MEKTEKRCVKIKNKKVCVPFFFFWTLKKGAVKDKGFHFCFCFFTAERGIKGGMASFHIENGSFFFIWARKRPFFSLLHILIL